MDYGIGIIGMGWVASNYHIPAYRAGNFNVVAICDIDKEVLETAQKKWGIEKVFTNYKEMLELKEVEIVDVAIRTFGRVPIVVDCAKAGKHLLVQKPFARSYHDGLAMVEAAEEAGVKLGVNSHYRWIPAFRGAHSLIEQGYIGLPYYIIDEMSGNQDDAYYHAMPERRWNAYLDDFMQVEWGAHHFDFVRFWTGMEPTAVFCSGTRRPGQNFKGEMIISYILEFPKGVHAAFLWNMANKFPDGRFDFRIEGTDGVIKGGGTHLELYSQKLGDEWFKWDLETMPGPGLPETYIGTMGDLMNAITENREHISSGRDNLNTVKAYLAGVLSEKLRRPVSPEEVSTYEQKHGILSV
jgi:predicted dehydrogenase